LQHQSNRIAESFPSKRVDRVDNKKKKKKKIIKHWASQTIGFSDKHGIIHCGALHHNLSTQPMKVKATSQIKSNSLKLSPPRTKHLSHMDRKPQQPLVRK
jgi:hypothetical protein